MKLIEFYVNKIKYTEGIENADLSFINPILRRRLSLLDRVSAASLYSCFNEKIQNIVFSSKTGEIERLLKIIAQYSTDEEISPSVFSSSVHNYAVSSYLMNEKKAVPYTALSAGTNSIFAGILTACVSKYSENLFVYSDIENNNYVSLCIHISKQKNTQADKYLIKPFEGAQIIYTLKDFVSFFNGNTNKLETAHYILERINND